MAYITSRVLAMGFPSSSCEKIYRNDLKDVLFYLNRYHPQYKVYNLCLEKNRIYRRETFPGQKVGLFPFMDHEPCPIKLMLEFCTDVCLYLIKNEKGTAVVHCKAGKGRTGVMIICYLIFSGLCNNSTEAIEYYAKMRTINKKGVTIPSQIRYIHYFETFLAVNFSKPYYRLIPQIMHYNITSRVANTLRNYINDDTYFFSENKFILKHLRLGPFNKKRDYIVNVASLITKHIDFPKKVCQLTEEGDKFYYDIEFNTTMLMNFDIKIECCAFKFNFYVWLNFWYATIENLFHYIMENNLINLSVDGKKKSFPKSQSSELFEGTSRPEGHIRNSIAVGRSMKSLSVALDMIKSVEESEKENSTDGIMDEKDTEELDDIKKSKTIYTSKSKQRSSIGKLIDILKDDKDLVQFIYGVNKIAEANGVEKFDMVTQKIILEKKDLDKFTDMFGVVDKGFLVEYTYSIDQGKV